MTDRLLRRRRLRSEKLASAVLSAPASTVTSVSSVVELQLASAAIVSSVIVETIDAK